jgi:hypothetical protein
MMTCGARAAGVAVTVTVLAGVVAFVIHSHHHQRRPASPTVFASSATTTTTPPITAATTTVTPTTSSATSAPSPPTTVAGPWQSVSQVAGLDELVTPIGTVLRIDPRNLDVAVVPGTAEPGGTFPEGGEVPPANRASLVMATNAGFKRADAHGGELIDGRTVGSLVAGAASLVIHTDGSINVGAWGGTVGPSPSVAAVVQNLSLLVDGGEPTADLSQNILQRWGATFRPAYPVYVWRSGAGIDNQGRLLFAAGPNLVPAQLAQLLISGGALRAMQLDINHLWVFAALFTHPDPQLPGMVQGQPLLSGMTPTANHVLNPGARDFLAIYRRPLTPA